MRLMTVGLPLWKSKHRGWIALEGLIRQRDIPCEWELIICEEPEECIGWNGLIPYKKKINELGGRIKYVPIPTWYPLSLKWIIIAKLSDPDSKYFLLQAGDCFSQPYRLRDTYDLFEETGANWIHSPVGYFYDVPTDKMYRYDRYVNGKDKPFGYTALNMATRTPYMRELPQEAVPYYVDGWTFRNVLKQCDRLHVAENTSDHWKLGFDSNGLNHISGYRAEMMGLQKDPFRAEPDVKITDIIDSTLVERLKKECEFLHSQGQYKYIVERMV